MTEFIVDLNEEAPLPKDKLDAVVKLARLQVQQMKDVAEAEVTLKRAVAALQRTREADLPMALAEAGMSSFTLFETGETIEVHKEVYASISEKRKEEACEWFIKNEYGDLVKNTITLTLPRGAVDVARRIIGGLKKLNSELETDEKFEMNQNRTIHHQTLQKFVRDADKAGREDLPEDLLGVYKKKVAHVILSEPEAL